MELVNDRRVQHIPTQLLLEDGNQIQYSSSLIPGTIQILCSPFAESSCLFPGHTYNRIISESRMTEISFRHRLIIRIREVTDPDQCIRIDLECLF